MKLLDGQLALFDLEPTPVPVLDETAPDQVPIDYCRACHSNWGRGLRNDVLERIAAEHAIQEDGRCAEMHRRGITEPYYTLEEIRWVRSAGWRLPYPRPRGFAGFYQSRAK